MKQLPGRPGGKPRLLVVDDSRVMRTAAHKMLGGQFDVVVAEHGKQGWDAIRADQSIQVVFTDLSMPELDGYGLLEKIRTCDDSGIAGLPVIVVTGAENDEAAREKALRLGATDFITKPFNSTDLLARASAHASYQRERRTLEAAVTIDPLTGLGNADYFMGRLKQDLAFAARHRHPLSVLRVEVDHFNKLFIRAGKQAADAMLMRVAEVISRLIRKEDTAARIGVAQFAVSLPSADVDGASVFANRLWRQVREVELLHEGRSVPLTVSIGVLSPSPHPGQTARTVLEEAALVLRTALQAGGDQVVTPAGVRSGLPGQPLQPASEPFVPPPISVEQALAMLASGRRDDVARHLSSLREQLAPLLEMLESKPQ